MHCRICGDCNPCTSGAHTKFCTRSLEFGYSTRFYLKHLSNQRIFYSWFPGSLLIRVWLLLSAAFLIYVVATISIVLVLVFHFEPLYGQSNILIYLGICSLAGSLTVNFCYNLTDVNYYILALVIHMGLTMVCLTCCLQVVSIKAVGIAIKLTLEGISQIGYPQTWVFLVVALICVIAQLNYLNKVFTFCVMFMNRLMFR